MQIYLKTVCVYQYLWFTFVSDLVCAVCGYGPTEDNQIILCDSCGVGVHLKCYAVSEDDLKQDQWFCIPCSQKVFARNPDGTPNLSRRCVACSHIGGAFSRTVDGSWIHTSCAMYLPKMEFTKNGVMTPSIPPSVPTHECELCHSTEGLTRKCNYLECQQYMHIHCMVRRLLFLLTLSSSSSLLLPSPSIVHYLSLLSLHPLSR